MNELALFAGAGGGILGGKLLGWRCICAVEIDRYARDVLVARQNDGCLDPFPIWDDIRTFDGQPWRGIVDVVSGGFPCQDTSAAGKGAGISGERSGLWSEMARIIGEVRPNYVFVENSPLLVHRGLAVVLSDLSAMGYDARWGIVGAHHAGAPHKRDRIWIVANSAQLQCNGGDDHAGKLLGGKPIFKSRDGGRAQDVANAKSTRLEGQRTDARQPEISKPRNDGSTIRDTAINGLPYWSTEPIGGREKVAKLERSDWWAAEPDVGRMVDGVAARVDRLKAIGNGQVPAVVGLAWNILTNKYRDEQQRPDRCVEGAV